MMSIIQKQKVLIPWLWPCPMSWPVVADRFPNSLPSCWASRVPFPAGFELIVAIEIFGEVLSLPDSNVSTSTHHGDGYGNLMTNCDMFACLAMGISNNVAMMYDSISEHPIFSQDQTEQDTAMSMSMEFNSYDNLIYCMRK